MLIISHRAKGSNQPENSLQAINSVKKLDIDMIEIDIQATKDNIAILRHDSFILNNGVKLNIKDLILTKLRDIDKNILTLKQALEIKDCHYLVEIKPAVDLEPILSILSVYQDTNNLIITSFDFSILKELKGKLPNIKLAVLDRWSGVRASRRAKILQTDILIMNQKWLWGGFIKSINNSGYKLIAYTLNDIEKAKKWQTSGLYGIITDEPVKLAQALNG